MRFPVGIDLVLRCLLVPPILAWDLLLLMLFLVLEIAWLGFVFGSVAGVILLLIFWTEGFLFPAVLLGMMISPGLPFEERNR